MGVVGYWYYHSNVLIFICNSKSFHINGIPFILSKLMEDQASSILLQTVVNDLIIINNLQFADYEIESD